MRNRMLVGLAALAVVAATSLTVFGAGVVETLQGVLPGSCVTAAQATAVLQALLPCSRDTTVTSAGSCVTKTELSTGLVKALHLPKTLLESVFGFDPLTVARRNAVMVIGGRGSDPISGPEFAVVIFAVINYIIHNTDVVCPGTMRVLLDLLPEIVPPLIPPTLVDEWIPGLIPVPTS